MIRNEDTGEVPECPFCGWRMDNDQECGHVLAVIDRTFDECEGGELQGSEWDYQQVLAAAIYTWLTGDEVPKWGEYPALQYVWEDAQSLWQEGSVPTSSDVPVWGYGFWSTLEDLFDRAGAISAPGPLALDGGMPGTSAAFSVLFAECPKKVIADAMKLLREYLNSNERLDVAV